MDSEEFTEVTFGSYRLSDGSYRPIDSENIVGCIAIEIKSLGEEAILLSRVEAQQFITNLYRELNKLS